MMLCHARVSSRLLELAPGSDETQIAMIKTLSLMNIAYAIADIDDAALITRSSTIASLILAN